MTSGICYIFVCLWFLRDRLYITVREPKSHLRVFSLGLTVSNWDTVSSFSEKTTQVVETSWIGRSSAKKKRDNTLSTLWERKRSFLPLPAPNSPHLLFFVHLHDFTDSSPFTLAGPSSPSIKCGRVPGKPSSYGSKRPRWFPLPDVAGTTVPLRGGTRKKNAPRPVRRRRWIVGALKNSPPAAVAYLLGYNTLHCPFPLKRRPPPPPLSPLDP